LVLFCQRELHTAERLVSAPSRLEAEIATARLKTYKSPGSDKSPAELVQTADELFLFAVHNMNNSLWNKEEFPHQWKEFLLNQFTTQLTYCRKSQLTTTTKKQNKQTPWPLVRERTIPTDRPPLVDEI
jgi:hypothetical protein